MKPISRKVVVLCASLVLLLGASFIFPATPAYATDPYLDKYAPSSGMTNKDIEYMNEHVILWLGSQRAVMRDMYQVYDDFHLLIDELVARRGEDAAAPLHDGSLVEFAQALSVAQSVHDQAAKVIGLQFGFDAEGKVTNRQAALQTVTEARANLRDVHFRLVIAVRDIRRAYAHWFRQFH
jgi:hypothetical protein